jgi:hypothetical protein
MRACPLTWSAWAAWSRAVGVALLLIGAPAAHTAPSALPPARDLAADGRAALKQGVPVIVLVSLGGCPQCEVVRRSHLLPLLAARAEGAPPLVRQVELGGGAALIDFNGEKITHAEFARRHQVKIAPVVFFFDGNGKPAAEPLLGAMIPDFYGAYFDEALAGAAAHTGAKRTPALSR